jgi:CubicO group peptidase (beta-lactamase class C family)
MSGRQHPVRTLTRCPARRGLVLLAVAGMLAPGPAEGQGTATDFRDLDQALQIFMREDSIVGGAVALVAAGRVTAHAEHGFADRAVGTPLGPDALFHWGSITKTLTAVAILQLRDRGLLALDDPITRWVPELRQVHNPYGSMDGITLRMLLSHSSGFQNPTWPYRRYVSWEPFEPTRWEQLVSMMPYQEILFPPGSRFGYSNPAFIYLARVIEAITGDPYQSYIYKNIWLPLGMTRSYFGTTPYRLAPFRPHNYNLTRDSAGAVRMVDNGQDFDPGITIPNGGWNAPLEDLATWMAFLSGVRANDTILRRESLAEMWHPIVVMEDSGGTRQSMGLGFFVVERHGVTLIGHTGEQAGFRSFFFFRPDRQTGVVAAVTTVNDVWPDQSAAAFRRFLAAALRVLAGG